MCEPRARLLDGLMSSPIKPPGSPSAPTPAADAGPAAPTDRVKESFQANLNNLDSASEVQAKSQPTMTDVVQDVVQRLEAGEIDATAAIDHLVEHALQHNGAQLLDPAQRLELESILRRALDEDPTLQSLKIDLEGR